ncbi:unnamed protein product [Didymodactylos carnosus]|uniref:NAD(P)(+)--arginine ADP-ribosyltransferase n=1 Tax=Didymodactylos carnosus TaxID=1234261 RepID=A0A8S2QB29_9BILA|nr:unnamed protein product [Didymodactylos carnosus]CAF4098783.1 unnamed protein product [Didymodactylos carnosus]
MRCGSSTSSQKSIAKPSASSPTTTESPSVQVKKFNVKLSTPPPKTAIDENPSGIIIYDSEAVDNAAASKQRDQRNASFMYFVLFIDILRAMPKNPKKGKEELVKEWERRCHKIEDLRDNKEKEKEIIKEFNDSYSPEKSIWWYTRICGLFRMLNEALREANLEVLLSLRIFLVDLYQQLTTEHLKFVAGQTEEKPVLDLFRGQLITKDEMNLIQESKGEYLTFNSFLSTSKNRAVSENFGLTQKEPKDGLTRVLFEIKIDTRLENTKPYADISQLSFVEKEDEILIMLGAIFKVGETKFDEAQQMYTAELSLCSQSEYRLKELLAQVKNEIGSGITSLGFLLYRQGKFEEAKINFQEVLKDNTLSDTEKAHCYNGLGRSTRELREYDEALEHFEQEVKLRKLSKDKVNEGTAYTYIGQVHWLKNELDIALSYEEKAEKVLLPLTHPDLSKVYQQMGNIYRDKNEFDLSIEYHMKVLAIYDEQKNVKEDYMRGVTYENLGDTYRKQGDEKKAAEYYAKSKQIYSKSLTSYHERNKGIEQKAKATEKQMDQK